MAARSSTGDLLAQERLVKKRRRRRPRQHPGGGTADHRGAQRPVDRRLQGAVSHPKRRLVLPLDDQRSAHPVSPELPRSADPGRPTGLRSDLPGVRVASSHPHRQRGALHLPRSAGLGRLNVWWLRLGILHQRIRPASPQENGAHERMHRTLEAATCRPPAANPTAQQRAFYRFPFSASL